MAAVESEREPRLTPNQIRLVRASRFSREDERRLDELLKGPLPDDPNRGLIADGLRSEYGLQGVDDGVLAPLVRLRVMRQGLRGRLGVSAQDEEGLREFIRVEPGEIDKYEDFAQSLRNMVRIQEGIGSRIGEWLDGRVDERVESACKSEIEGIKFLTFIENLGGVGEYHKVPGIITETVQTGNRFLSDIIGFTGYNTLLDTDLTERIKKRFEGQRQVNILDSGCGKGSALAELVQNLDKEWGGHTVLDEGGEKIVLFRNGKRLKLVGVSRLEYKPHQDYINYVVSDINQAPLKGPFDEIWDVYGPLTYILEKKELLEKYYRLLRKDGDGGEAGAVRIATNEMIILPPNLNKPLEELNSDDVEAGGRELSRRVDGFELKVIRRRSLAIELRRLHDQIQLPLGKGEPVAYGGIYVTGVREIYKVESD
ncbi:MAG: hypothetical protein ABIH11_01055 [Candidatus Altiarchaeota archaeon]